jgi:hypothetical protein
MSISADQRLCVSRHAGVCPVGLNRAWQGYDYGSASFPVGNDFDCAAELQYSFADPLKPNPPPPIRRVLV